jgi:hypothetical protein
MVGQLLIALLRETFYARDVTAHGTFLPYFVYIDEFQQYAAHSEEALLEMFNGLRKYNIGLTIAHQTTRSISPKMCDTIVGNVGTLGCFRIAADEAPYFARELSVIERRPPKNASGKTVEEVREDYETLYREYHNANREQVLNNVLAEIRKLEAEAIRGHHNTPEEDPLGRLRPDLLQEPAMPPYHLIMRGAGVEGSLLLEVQEHPFDTATSRISYHAYVQHSQEKYGTSVQASLPTPPPPEEEDEYRIRRQE